MTDKLIAMYKTSEAALAAARDLLADGVPRERIRVIRERPRQQYQALVPGPEWPSNRGYIVGATAGLLVGATLGALFAVIVGVLAGSDWILGTDPFASIAGSVAVGALLGLAAGGLGAVQRYNRRGSSRAARYEEAVRSGEAVVAVEAEEAWGERVSRILQRYGPIDIDEHITGWNEQEWGAWTLPNLPASEVGQPVPLRPTPLRPELGERPDTGEGPLHEEPLRQTRPGEEVARGAGVVEPPPLPEREPTAPGPRRPVSEVLPHDELADRQRHTRADAERLGEGPLRGFEPELREHFEQNWGTTGADWEVFREAYSLGISIARSDREGLYSWPEVEEDARRRWHGSLYGGTPFDEVREAVRHGYETGRVAPRLR